MSKFKQFPFNTMEIYYQPKSLSLRKRATAIDIDKDATTVIKSYTVLDQLGNTVEPESSLETNSLEGLKIVDYSATREDYHVRVEYILETGYAVQLEIKGPTFRSFLLNKGSIDRGVISGKWNYINDRGAKLVPSNSQESIDYFFKNNIDLSTTKKVKVEKLKVGEITKLRSSLTGTGTSDTLVFLGKTFNLTFGGYRGMESNILSAYIFGQLSSDGSTRLVTLLGTETNLYNGIILSPEEEAKVEKFKKNGFGEDINYLTSSKKSYGYRSAPKDNYIALTPSIPTGNTIGITSLNETVLESFVNEVKKDSSTVGSIHTLRLKHKDISDYWDF